MSVKLIRLISGEFLMADVESDLNSLESVTLRDPVVLMLSKESVGLAPFNPFGTEDTLVINGQHVLYVTEPQEDLLSEYNRAFSRIQIASASLLQ